VGHRRLAWQTVGAGPPLILVNGYAATAADWDPTFLGALAESFRVICLDNRGMGNSELGDPREISVSTMASDVEALMDALALEHAQIIGWSMGGFVAQHLAVRTPARVQTLVLLATDPGGSVATPADRGTWERLIDHTGSAREQASRLIALLFPASLAPDIDRQFGDVVAEARDTLSPIALRAQESAIEHWHASDQPLPGADAPRTLAACGTEDVVIPPANTAALAARWPGCRVHTFQGGGHAFMAQEPQRLAQLITSFLMA
jgi:pimeloyl-ACP methyl ester carboxylesterase